MMAQSHFASQFSSYSIPGNADYIRPAHALEHLVPHYSHKLRSDIDCHIRLNGKKDDLSKTRAVVSSLASSNNVI